MIQKKLTVLLIEDNYGDEKLVREALSESKRGTTLHVVKDGVEALAYLRQDSGDPETPRPDLILMDLSIPKKSGLEVLAEIKGERSLASIPVLMLTTSDSLRDREKCIELAADAYIRKPIDLDDFFKLIQSTESDWLEKLSRLGGKR
jgi:two-component system, chemotaxis family, response regulator Rcp1